MKKWLLLFVLLDFVFVGLVLKLSSENQRNLANYSDPFYSDLTDGQKNKYNFVKSLLLQVTNEQITLKTDRLQALCQVASLIEVEFKALNVAYAGEHPTISHTYSCEEIKKDLSMTELSTSTKDFFSLQTQKKIPERQMASALLYSDEEFPLDWCLYQLRVSGESHFTITREELEKVQSDHRFDFKLASTYSK
jgi:hypothetical protein